MLDLWSRQMIEGKVAAGRLAPQPENATYGGPSNGGSICAACDRPIHAGEIEVESVVPGGRERRFFHAACHQYMVGAY